MDTYLKDISSAAPPQIPSRSVSPSFGGPSRSGSPTLSQMQGQMQGQRIGNIIGVLPTWEIRGRVYKDMLLEPNFKDLKDQTKVFLTPKK